MQLPQITSTRFIAAISVVIYHYGRDVFPFNILFLKKWFDVANIGVSYFFLLSGFILTIVYYEKNIRNQIRKSEFYILRIARVYPIYIISLLLIIIPRLISSWEILATSKFAVHLLLLQSWVPKYTLTWNFPAWSLSVEIFFYLLFPFVLAFLTKLNGKSLYIFMLVFWLISLTIFIYYVQYLSPLNNKLTDTFFLFNPIPHLNAFIFGVGGGIIFRRTSHRISPKIAALFLIVSIITFIILIYMPNSIIKYAHNGMMAPVFILFLFGIILNESVISRILSMRYAEVLGEISYGIYILQEPVRILLDNILFTKTWFLNNLNLRFYFYLVVLFLISYISFYLIEKPLRNAVKYYLTKRFANN